MLIKLNKKLSGSVPLPTLEDCKEFRSAIANDINYVLVARDTQGLPLFCIVKLHLHHSHGFDIQINQ